MSSGYRKTRLVPVPHKVTQKNSWRARKHSEKNLKGILKDAGYTDEQITKLNKEGRIMITTKYLSTTLKASQKLYVLEVPDDFEDKDSIDRFSALELD